MHPPSPAENRGGSKTRTSRCAAARAMAGKSPRSQYEGILIERRHNDAPRSYMTTSATRTLASLHSCEPERRDLNSYLCRINAADSDFFGFCGCPETVRHFLLECPRWIVKQAQYLQLASARWSETSYILVDGSVNDSMGRKDVGNQT
jgi:hypothetical protein